MRMQRQASLSAVEHELLWKALQRASAYYLAAVEGDRNAQKWAIFHYKVALEFALPETEPRSWFEAQSGLNQAIALFK